VKCALDYALKQFAGLALANLSTKASLAALAQMLLDNNPGTYEYMTAAENLGKTHDPAWFPLLLEVADQHGAMYISYAAESGGDAAMTALLAPSALSRSQHSWRCDQRLGHTGSRTAVPVLISLLGAQAHQKDENGRNAAIFANAALRQLTHVYAEQGSGGASIPSWHSRWQNWWLTSGPTASIYKPDDCVADTKLP
jgi:hypothetical protein